MALCAAMLVSMCTMLLHYTCNCACKMHHNVNITGILYHCAGRDAKRQNAVAFWDSQFLAQCPALDKGYMQRYRKVG